MLPLVLLAGLLVSACGGGEEKTAASSEDVNRLLQETFSSGKQIKSGTMNLQLALDLRGRGAVQGPVNLAVTGPFERTGAKQLPKFRLDVKFSGLGQNLTAGATSTGKKGYVAFQGQDYVVSDEVFAQFKQGFEQGQAKQGKSDQSFASLGMDPRKWLRDPKNEGEAKVGDEDTIKITGGVDVPRLLDDISGALERAGSLGGGQTQDKLTEKDKREVEKSVKGLNVEIYTGKDDKILRRMVVAADLAATASSDQGLESAKVRFDLALADVNQGQDIEAPENAKPFDELMQQLGGLGLGGLGTQGSGGAGSSGSGSANGGGGASSDALEQYSDCIRKAGSDADKAQKCADLLTP